MLNLKRSSRGHFKALRMRKKKHMGWKYDITNRNKMWTFKSYHQMIKSRVALGEESWAEHGDICASNKIIVDRTRNPVGHLALSLWFLTFILMYRMIVSVIRHPDYLNPMTIRKKIRFRWPVLAFCIVSHPRGVARRMYINASLRRYYSSIGGWCHYLSKRIRLS